MYIPSMEFISLAKGVKHMRIFSIEYILLKKQILDIYCDVVDKKDADIERRVRTVNEKINNTEKELYEDLKIVGKKRLLEAFTIMRRIHKLQELEAMLKQCK